jgi:cardiolipin synthase
MSVNSILVGFSLAVLLYVLYRAFWVTASLRFGADHAIDLADPHAVDVVASIADATITTGNRLEVLTDGKIFYPAELDAMRRAESTITAEFYVFWLGTMVDEFVEVLSERVLAGVRVHLLVDGFGAATFGVRRRQLRRLRRAGCEVRFYHPFMPRLLDKINIRTHREIIVVDGRVAFVGGAGVADHWMVPRFGKPWRDMMVRVEGRAVNALQGVFVENWVEASGDALTAPEYFPKAENPGNQTVLVINSSSRGRSSATQVLHRLLLASARESITIATPYFLPDKGVRGEIAAAAQRGVRVRILTVGAHSNLWLVRAGGRRIYGELLDAGVEIFEYEPGMFHVKMLVVDELWAVVGTTNFDSRSFMINDEVNIASTDPDFCRRLLADIAADLSRSAEIVHESWSERPIKQRIWEQVSRVFERQQ